MKPSKRENESKAPARRRTVPISRFVSLLIVLTAPYRACGDGPVTFTDVTSKTRISFVHTDGGSGRRYIMETVSAGLALFDYDGDGDVVILNSRREPTLLRNDSARKGHWLQVRLRGVKTNRDGVGAHVKVTAGELTLLDEVHSGRGYQSHYGTRLHFGLGNTPKADRIEVRWIGGGVDVFEDIPADRQITLTEGTSRN